MEWNGQICTEASDERIEDLLDMETLAEMRRILTKKPTILVEICVSCDDTCPFVQSITQLPNSDQNSHPLALSSGIPVYREEGVPKGQMLQRYSDGSVKLTVSNPVDGKVITFDGGHQMVKRHINKITEGIERWKIQY